MDLAVRSVFDGSARWGVAVGDCLTTLRTFQAGRVQLAVTSPPYYNLRDYGADGQIGMEKTPAEFIAALVAVFDEVRRVLAADGLLYVNIGDTYANDAPGRQDKGSRLEGRAAGGLKKKDRIGIPHMLAFALRDAGWWWRDEIIWDKPNPLTESVRDRCTRSHEFVFMFSKSARYYYDQEAVSERAAYAGKKRGGSKNRYEQNAAGMDGKVYDTRNKRSVWRVTPARQRHKGTPGVKHFAPFPAKLVEPCVLAGSRPGDIVLDPFAGTGTTLAVALEYGRRAVGCELNPEYIPLIQSRMAGVQCRLIPAGG